MHRVCLGSYFLLRWMAENTIGDHQWLGMGVDRGWEKAGAWLCLPLPVQEAETETWLCKEDKGGDVFLPHMHGQRGREKTNAWNTGFLSRDPYLQFAASWLALLTPRNCPPEELRGGAGTREPTNKRMMKWPFKYQSLEPQTRWMFP